MDFLRRHAWWIVPLILLDLFFVHRWLNRDKDTTEELVLQPSQEVAMMSTAPEVPLGLLYTYPTDQRDLLDTESLVVYQPTASGRVESALYGTVRTRSFGGRLLPAFHEGIDIASMRRDRRGRALDEIYAVADGQIAYINRVGGNSSYGIYVVLAHDDPLGEIYTLYSHLARVESDLRAGQTVQRGQTLGVMGNTASTGIPMVRAHLHFEIGVINNARFHQWYRAQELIPDHGNYHGHNLTGVQPLAIYEGDGYPLRFSMRDYLKELPPGFILLFRHARPLDYFKRYPYLWMGPPHEGDVQVMAVSEGGVPLSGRAATETEAALLGRDRTRVLMADEEVLGRNGLRLVVRRQGNWEFGNNGERWLEILTY